MWGRGVYKVREKPKMRRFYQKYLDLSLELARIYSLKAFLAF